MHFSIPDTEECKDDRGSSFTSYNLHVNGVFHCSVRYSQFHDFHEQLKKESGNSFYGHDRFPPKKLLPLTSVQKKERRERLEKYIQAVSQDGRIVNGDLFKGFLLSAQKETRREEPRDESLNVYLMNGNKVTIDIKSTDQTDDVTEAAAAKIGLPDDLVYFFALFIMKETKEKHAEIVRRLQDFESPYISLNSAEGRNKLVFRRCYWDPIFDDEVMSNRVALQLLFIQTVQEVQQGWLTGTKEQFKRLDALRIKNSRREYLQFAKTMKYYGHIIFKPCIVDYPEPDTKVTISAENKELYFRVKEEGKDKEGVFRITRIRCWRISLLGETNPTGDHKSDSQLQLSFEYLVSKSKLQWINVVTEEAILMSLTLQSMVEELLLVKRGGKVKRPSDRIKGPTRQFKGRDGGVVTSVSSTTPGIPEDSSKASTQQSEEDPKPLLSTGSVKKITSYYFINIVRKWKNK
ncbi:sorting nexin-17-like isoform X1 [Apostichopus japonicus]|uniref:sorting nexin-17-like isoform X1 n=1 Tax=Stichopus japonicus TaxID=307972 RepID=UPI003AB6112E